MYSRSIQEETTILSIWDPMERYLVVNKVQTSGVAVISALDQDQIVLEKGVPANWETDKSSL